MYFVYLLQCYDKSLYTGITTDLKKRLQKHKSGKGGHYTAAHMPEKIVYSETFATRSQALRCEAQIKSWPRKKKQVLVNS